MITRPTVKALIAGGGLLATWFAVGPNHSAQSPTSQPSARPSAVLHQAAADDLNAQTARLRTHPTGSQLRPSTRNPFRFGTKPMRQASPSSPHVDLPETVAAAPVAPGPSYTLLGVAERQLPDGRKRTAIISGGGQLYLVAEGEMVAGRYTVVRIDPEAALLRDQSGAEFSLVLQ